jgi:hypothetical protein
LCRCLLALNLRWWYQHTNNSAVASLVVGSVQIVRCSCENGEEMFLLAGERIPSPAQLSVHGW